jgi:hypothetical protein
MYLKVYAPRLQWGQGVVGFFRRHLGQPVASSASMAPRSRNFVALIYRERRPVETLLRALKQNLRIKTFVGISPNTLKIQIWTALIALLLLKYLQLRASYGWPLSNLLALLRPQLFVYRGLFTWLNRPFEPPPDASPRAVVQLLLPAGNVGKFGQHSANPTPTRSRSRHFQAS